MTWIRCSDRMPMGEAVEARAVAFDGGWAFREKRFDSANVETLRREYGDADHWIDRTEWRPAEEPEPNGLGEAFGAWPGDESDEEIEAALQERTPEEETLHAALRRYGLREQLAMLTEECGELVAAVNRWRRGREGAFPALLEEIADVEILIDQMRLELGAEIDEARARKVARLRERLER